MKTIIEITYEVRRSHSDIIDLPLLKTDRLNTVINFLKKRKDIERLDVKLWNFDGEDFDSDTWIADIFLHQATRLD